MVLLYLLLGNKLNTPGMVTSRTDDVSISRKKK